MVALFKIGFAHKIVTCKLFSSFILPMLMYQWSPKLSQISLKNSFVKGVFQIVAKIEMY